MPNEVKKNDDGTVEVKLETGEVYKGDPFDVLNKMGDSYVSGKRWTQNIKAENETLKAQRLNPPEPPAPVQPVNQDEAALDSYLLERQAKALGYKTGPEFKQAWEYGRQVVERQANEQVAADFMMACPEFTGEKDAVDKLSAKVDSMGWQYDPQSLMAAHLLCMREGAYRVLNTDEVNMAANRSASQQTTAKAPPQPPGGNNPDGSQNNVNPWQMSQDELKKQILSQGGLGKALMDLKPGDTFGV